MIPVDAGDPLLDSVANYMDLNLVHRIDHAVGQEVPRIHGDHKISRRATDKLKRVHIIEPVFRSISGPYNVPHCQVGGPPPSMGITRSRAVRLTSCIACTSLSLSSNTFPKSLPAAASMAWLWMNSCTHPGRCGNTAFHQTRSVAKPVRASAEIHPLRRQQSCC